ncbi:hypothetical protein HU200_003593 [Digitaria exilis]|uniref:Uncharacterized protein n=1 Tax=Digitaria exilis TaxID=1010633 RepID=A0A835FUT8_9POAL|nr:hypothetical protein HU200_003593 [Digitaria exilis]
MRKALEERPWAMGNEVNEFLEVEMEEGVVMVNNFLRVKADYEGSHNTDREGGEGEVLSPLVYDFWIRHWTPRKNKNAPKESRTEAKNMRKQQSPKPRAEEKREHSECRDKSHKTNDQPPAPDATMGARRCCRQPFAPPASQQMGLLPLFLRAVARLAACVAARPPAATAATVLYHAGALPRDPTLERLVCDDMLDAGDDCILRPWASCPCCPGARA